MRAWRRDDDINVDVHVDSDCEIALEEVDEWRHDDDQRHCGEALVGNTSDASVSTAEADLSTRSSQGLLRVSGCSR